MFGPGANSWRAACNTAIVRDYRSDCYQKFETGDLNAESVIMDWKTKGPLGRALSTFFYDEDKIKYDIAKEVLEDRAKKK
jgi:hypothetical protein